MIQPRLACRPWVQHLVTKRRLGEEKREEEEKEKEKKEEEERKKRNRRFRQL